VAVIEGDAAMAASKNLFGKCQLTRRPIDGIFKLVSAGLARPQVPNAVIGKMFGPFWCDEKRTTLGALVA
jgi:hypothetical protein